MGIPGANDSNNIDLFRCTRAGYIMPGIEVLMLRVNEQSMTTGKLRTDGQGNTR